jgi:hypothetical protein
MKRARGTGRYTYDEKYERLCVCGHPLGKHSAESPHDCFVGQFGEPESCECPKFRPAKQPEVPGFKIWKQSSDYLYGWQWERVSDGKRGEGYRTKRSAAEAARRELAGTHESGSNPTVSQQRANRKKTPRRWDYGQGLHVEYSPGNAAYFVMWHHEVLSIRPTWEAADEHARGLVANKTKDGSDECQVVSSHAAVVLRRTQSGEPAVVEHYRRMSEALARARSYMGKNPPGEHGHITVESREPGRHQVKEFTTEPKNAFEWKWKGK